MAADQDKTTYLSTIEAYDRWAAVYDTDGNHLQKLDDEELNTMLPEFLNLLLASSSTTVGNDNSNNSSSHVKIVDLGCGTGRNTAKLLTWQFNTHSVEQLSIVGLDGSPQMLEHAKTRCGDILAMKNESFGTRLVLPTLELRLFSIPLEASQVASALFPVIAKDADAIISTLVLEHLPLATFFAAASTMLRPQGLLLLTNMHPEMGAISQAGFRDPQTGEKVRGKSWIHTIEETVQQGKLCGFSLVGSVKERGVEESDIEKLGERARKWVGLKCWFGMIFQKTSRLGESL